MLAYAAVVSAAYAPPLYYAPTARIAAIPAYAPTAYAPAPLKYAPKAAYHDEYDADPSYSYGYHVHDQLSGDSKSQQETRQGDVVHGSYSLIEPDGSKRIVEYTADPHNGFNAVVHKEPVGAGVPTLAAKAYAPAPVVQYAPAKYALPIPAAHYAAPILTYAH